MNKLSESPDSNKREVLIPELLPREGDIITQPKTVSGILRGIHDRIADFMDSIRPHKGNESIYYVSDDEEIADYEELGVPEHFGEIVAEIYAVEDKSADTNQEEHTGHHLRIFNEEE